MAYGWRERAPAYDAYLDGRTREEQERQVTRDLGAYRERQRRVSMAEPNLAVRQLQKVARSLDAMEATKDAPETLLEPEQIPAWVRAAITLCESEALSVDTILAAIGAFDAPARPVQER